MATRLNHSSVYYLPARIRQPLKPVFGLRFPIKSPLLTRSFHTMDEQQARGQHSTQVEQWKQRAPYRIHESNEHFNARYDANCHCGKVKYQLSREEPLDSKLCHCTTCQTQHGRETDYDPAGP